MIGLISDFVKGKTDSAVESFRQKGSKAVHQPAKENTSPDINHGVLFEKDG